MKIPKRFKLAGTAIEVHTRRTLRGNVWGRAWLDMNCVEIATHSKGKPRPLEGPVGVSQTFWHEATHLILSAMGNKLCDDEMFVNRFGKLLAEICETAEF